MGKKRYYVTADNKTVATNMELDVALLLIKALLEKYYNDYDIVYAIAEMESENDQ